MRSFLLILCCILLYGSATFFKRLGLEYLHPYQFLLIAALCYFAAAPLWFYLFNQQVEQQSYPITGIIYVILYAGFSLGAALILAFLLKRTDSPGALIVMVNLSSLITLLLCCLFLQEKLTIYRIIALCMAAGSLFLMNL